MDYQAHRCSITLSKSNENLCETVVDVPGIYSREAWEGFTEEQQLDELKNHTIPLLTDVLEFNVFVPNHSIEI